MSSSARFIVMLLCCFYQGLIVAQQGHIIGHITDTKNQPIAFANIQLLGNSVQGSTSDNGGHFHFEDLEHGEYKLKVSFLGFKPHSETLVVTGKMTVHITLEAEAELLEETVVTGTLKPVSRLESPVPVEVYSPSFIQKNPTANIFEALTQVNGVRPQVNCNVCNTGDIHINGLEGPYTAVMIDGMPIVSGLGTVYGLSGIPNSLIQQVEIVKGPASSLYGSEAVGGLINIITKTPEGQTRLDLDAFATDWGEYNLDLGASFSPGDKTHALLGINYFNYSDPRDDNGDNFTDLTLQDRISLFQKWSFERKEDRLFSLAGRFFYEDRWGGELQWTLQDRLGDQVYGESIFTRRWEFLGKYALPFSQPWILSFSYNDHNQDAAYGDTPYLADQRIGFAQLTHDRKINKHDLLFGAALRYQYYDDNTPATAGADRDWIPGIFLQDEISLHPKHNILLGSRLDLHEQHGLIYTPRLAYRFKPDSASIFRVNFGSGFRVVNLFTEDHAALTGARNVIIEESLKPERSQNVNLNFLKKWYLKRGTFMSLDASVFYTYFSNAIIPDYETNPTEIRYRNLDGSASSAGLSLNYEVLFPGGIRLMAGGTLQEVTNDQNGTQQRQLLTESYSGTWTLSVPLRNLKTTIDYTGNLYGPMRLPLLGPTDPRPEFSPAWSIQNIQFTFKGLKGFEIYGGVKNLLNWTPGKNLPFLIARSDDPFDRNVVVDPQGNPQATPNNPFALTFDPTYVYASNQGIRSFFGLRYRAF